MKIAHILWTFDIGGIQTMLVDIVNEQVKHNQVTILIVNNQISEALKSRISNNVQIVFCKRKVGSYNIYPIIKLNWIIHRINPDIIHCHEDRITKVIWGCHNMVRTIHNTQSKPYEYIKFRKLCCISDAVKDYTAKQGFPNALVVHNGVDITLIRKKKRYPNKESPIKAVCVGRLNEMKGQIVIIEALNILINKTGLQQLSVDLIGDYHGDWKYKKLIETKVSEYKLNSHVNFLGQKTRDYCYDNLCNYDLFIMPSTSEGFGLSLAEACVARVPVIASDLPSLMEVLAGGRNGHIFKSGDPESLAEAMEDYIINGVDLVQVNNASNYVKKKFDVKITASKYLDVYSTIISEK